MRKETASWDGVPNRPQPTNPAAGADFTYTIPSQFRALLLGICASLVSDANAANRGVRIKVVSSAGKDMYIYPAAAAFANQTASHAENYLMAIGATVSDGVDQTDRQGVLPDHFELAAGTVISTLTTNIQVGDQWTITWLLKLLPA